jgi:hypothetical protein
MTTHEIQLMIKYLIYHLYITRIRKVASFIDNVRDDDMYLHKLQRESVTKLILYTFPYRPAKKA